MSENIEIKIEAICDFIKAYERRKYEIMVKGGALLGPSVFMIEYCQQLRLNNDKGE